MITLYLEAESMMEMRRKVYEAFGIGVLPPGLYPPPSEAGEAPPASAEAQEAPTPRKTQKRAVRAPVAETVVEPETGNLPDMAPEQGPTDAEAGNPVDFAKIKAEVIGTLSDLFTAGKVKLVREMLDTYGGGAKSLPEIDAQHFPAIKKALAQRMDS